MYHVACNNNEKANLLFFRNITGRYHKLSLEIMRTRPHLSVLYPHNFDRLYSLSQRPKKVGSEIIYVKSLDGRWPYVERHMPCSRCGIIE